MAPARPSSPTSLLWAHQLKREHGYLLKRMQDLESTAEKQDSLIKGAEAAAKSHSSGELAALAKQIKDLDDPALNNTVKTMKEDFDRRIDDVQADSEALALQVAAMQEERQEDVRKDKILMERIATVEEGLKKYEGALEGLGKKIDGQKIGLIREQLDDLSQRVRREGCQMKLLAESIEKLEEATGHLRKACDDLSEKARVRDEAVAKKEREEAEAAAHAKSATSATPTDERSRQKKSHKWSGGGADRDIIMQGANLIGPRSSAKQPVKKATPVFPNPATVVRQLDHHPGRAAAIASRKIAPPKKKKNPVPKQPVTPGDRKSHKWSGGGADRDIVAAGHQLDGVNRKRSRTVEEEEERPPAKKARMTKTDNGKPIVRSGKGWYEVLESPSPEPEDDVEEPPPKRGPGRPRKQPRLSDETVEVQGRQSFGKRRAMFPTLRDDEMEIITQGGGRRTKKARISEPMMKIKKEDSEAPDIVVSTDRSRTGKQSMRPDVYFSSPAPEEEQSRPTTKRYSEPQRRRIIQDDDDD